jgi:CRP-like cAMP-binding protein
MLILADQSIQGDTNETGAAFGLIGYLRKTHPDFATSYLFPSGVELFRQGEQGQKVLVLESGFVKLTRLENNGREFIVSLQFPGSLLGVSAVVCSQRHAFCAATVTPCKLIQISRVQFSDLMFEDQHVSSLVNRWLGQEVCDLTINLTQLACIPVQQRLQQLLWRLTKCDYAECSIGGKIRLPLKYWEVAALLAVTPAYLTRLFNELENNGLLSRHKGWIKIPARNKLWHDSAFDYIQGQESSITS